MPVSKWWEEQEQGIQDQTYAHLFHGTFLHRACVQWKEQPFRVTSGNRSPIWTAFLYISQVTPLLYFCAAICCSHRIEGLRDENLQTFYIEWMNLPFSWGIFDDCCSTNEWMTRNCAGWNKQYKYRHTLTRAGSKFWSFDWLMLMLFTSFVLSKLSCCREKQKGKNHTFLTLGTN